MRGYLLYLGGVISGGIIAACVPATAVKQDALEAAPMKQLQTVVEVWNRIKSDYVDAVDDTRIMQGCINGMASLDGVSRYIPASEYLELSGAKSWAAVGLELQVRNGLLIVISPLEGSPASRAGIRSGDTISSIDGNPTQGRSLLESVTALRGEPGAPVTLKLWRDASTPPVELTLVRENIKSSSVRVQMLDDGIVYLRISSFTTETPGAVTQAVAGATAGQTARGMVLDLRNNPGGVLDSVIKVAGMFAADGTVASLEGRKMMHTLTAKGPSPFSGIPVVMLVDHGTGSGAEILAEFLRSQTGAKILGLRTFGAGTVQTIMPMKDHGALKLATARWRTARGDFLEGKGIAPDAELPDEEPVVDAKNDPWVRQAAVRLGGKV